MLNLPKSTEFGKRIPKQTFYENMDVSQEIRKLFSEQIKTVYWMNKISSDTINLSPGKNIKELQVFKINLNQCDISEIVLKQIDKIIPYHILYVCEYESKTKVFIPFKEINGNKISIGGYYSSEWETSSEINLSIKGNNLDAVYENFIKEIAGNRLIQQESEESLKETIAKTEKRNRLIKNIAVLDKKMWAEKQAKKKLEYREKINALKKELEAL